MSGDTTIQALSRLTYFPDREDSKNGEVIAGQKYYDVYFTGGNINNLDLNSVNIELSTITASTLENCSLNYPVINYPTINNVETINYNASSPEYLEGRTFYDEVKRTLSYYNDVSDITVNLGQELLIPVFNNTGSTIENGKVVYPAGTDITSGLPSVDLADCRYKDKSRLVAVATHDIENGTKGYVTRLGSVGGLDTTGLSGEVYLGFNGNITMDRPDDGCFAIPIGVVGVIDDEEGTIIVDPNITELTVEVTDTNGYPPDQRTGTTISFNDLTREFTIAPVGDSFHYYQLGEKFEQTTAQTVEISDVTGMHIIYFDEEELKYIENPSEAQKDDIIRNKVITAYVYWDSSIGEHVYLGDERHGISMSPVTHAYLHFTRGTQYFRGLALNTINASGNGDSDSHAQFGVDSGAIIDEDLMTTSDSIASTVGLPIFYLEGATGVLKREFNAGFSVLTEGTGRLAYNEWTGTEWKLTEVTNNNFALYHVFAGNDIDYHVFAVMGQNQYNTIAQARAGANNEISAILLRKPEEELVPLGTILFQTSDSYSNAVKSRIRTNDDGEAYTDWRTTQLARGVAPTDHNNLANLQIAGSGVSYGHIDSARPLATPSMTTTARDVFTPVNGFVIYNTTDNQYQIYDNGAWRWFGLVKQDITGQSSETIASGDSILFSDVDDSGNLKKTTVSDIIDLTASTLASKADTVITASDKITFYDVSDSELPKTDTVQGILDLVPTSSQIKFEPVTSSFQQISHTAGIQINYAPLLNNSSSLIVFTQQTANYPLNHWLYTVDEDGVFTKRNEVTYAVSTNSLNPSGIVILNDTSVLSFITNSTTSRTSVVLFTVASNTLTERNTVTFDTAVHTTGSVDFYQINDTTLLYCYNRGNNVFGCVLTVSGNTVSKGTEVQLTSVTATGTTNVKVVYIEPLNKYLVICNRSTTNLHGRIFSVSGTSITVDGSASEDMGGVLNTKLYSINGKDFLSSVNTYSKGQFSDFYNSSTMTLANYMTPATTSAIATDTNFGTSVSFKRTENYLIAFNVSETTARYFVCLRLEDGKEYSSNYLRSYPTYNQFGVSTVFFSPLKGNCFVEIASLTGSILFRKYKITE